MISLILIHNLEYQALQLAQFSFNIVMNNILPSRPSQFLSKQYWNSFFSKLKSSKQDQFFEWYGNFDDYRQILEKLLPKNSRVLNIGCGKSLFAEHLIQAKLDCEVVSCDYSEQVVKDMQARADKKGIKTLYEVADVFNMQYKDESFDVVFDKGTLDAVFPEETEQNVNRLTKQFFPKILQILTHKPGSKYIIVSLLQQHILKLLLSFFGKQLNYVLSFYECQLKDSKLQPFLVSIQYKAEPRKDNGVILFLKDNKYQPQTVNPTHATNTIMSLQAHQRFVQDIPKLISGQSYNINVFDEKTRQPRYNLDILDNESPKLIEKGNCMVLIVPQGKERTFLFGTKKGLKMLHDQVPCARLIVAKMVTGNEFSHGLEGVKKELNPIVKDLLPKGCKPSDVPYVTDSEEIGQREYIFKDKDHIIEEVKIEDNYYRRLIIASNIGMVQSQYRLTYFNEKNPQKQYLHEINKLNLLPQKKKGMLVGIDQQYLEEGGYEQATIAGLELLDEEILNKPKVTVLVLGGGACVLSKFLYNNFKNMDITTIEIDGKIIELAEKYFEVKQDDRFRVLKYDGLKYIFETAAKGIKYDLIIFDINGGVDGQPSPSPIFLTKEFLGLLGKIQSPGGLLIYHLIHRETLPQPFTLHFNPIYTWTDEVVTMVYCRNEPIIKKKDKNGKQVIVTKLEYQEIPKKGKFEWEAEILSKLKLHWPRIGGVFEGTEVFYENQDGELVNSAKNMYKEEFEKVNKKKKKNRR